MGGKKNKTPRKRTATSALAIEYYRGSSSWEAGGGAKKKQAKQRLRKLSMGATRVICLHPKSFCEISEKRHRNVAKKKARKRESSEGGNTIATTQ